MTVKNGMRPVHPGEILREEYMAPLDLSITALALALRVPATRIHAIVKEERSITPDTAIRLARYFGTTPQLWLNLQNTYDIKIAMRTFRPEEVLPFAETRKTEEPA